MEWRYSSLPRNLRNQPTGQPKGGTVNWGGRRVSGSFPVSVKDPILTANLPACPNSHQTHNFSTTSLLQVAKSMKALLSSWKDRHASSSVHQLGSYKQDFYFLSLQMRPQADSTSYKCSEYEIRQCVFIA